MGTRLDVIIVDYNAGRLLGECLESVRDDPAVDLGNVTVVDNASSDDSAQDARDRFGVHVLDTGRNAGFAVANNVGLAASTAEYVLLLNPDTRLDSGGIASLVEFMDLNPAVGLVGPKLVDANGVLQLSIGNYPTVLREAFECLFLHRAFPKAATRWADSVWDGAAYAGAKRTDWVSGPVMLARVSALREIGGFDEGFFLYSEEIDLCHRLTDAGWEVWYCPDVVFVHVGGEFDANPALAVENQRSKLRYFLKHEGRLRMLLFSAVIVLRLAIRSVLWLPVALARGDVWTRRLRAALHTLVRYPRLVGEFAVAPRPATLRMDRSEEPAA